MDKYRKISELEEKIYSIDYKNSELNTRCRNIVSQCFNKNAYLI